MEYQDVVSGNILDFSKLEFNQARLTELAREIENWRIDWNNKKIEETSYES